MKLRLRFLYLALAAILAVARASGGSKPLVQRLDGSMIAAAEIDSTVERLMKAAEVPGVGIAILNDGQIVYLKAYGVRDRENRLPLRADSIMSAASFSKVAFAYLAMQLVQQGVLDLDKPVYRYLPKPLPEYAKYKDLGGDSRYRQITARMLLSHTAGFPNWRWFNEDHKLNINFTPGSRFAYSGEGIDLLQFVVETITKKPLERLMQEHVFRLLGMTRSSMVWHDDFESDFANGYDEYGRSLGPQRRKEADAAGSLLTTIHDFAYFVQAVMAGTGLRKNIQEQMLSPQVRIRSKHEFPSLAGEMTNENDGIRLSYGLGWGLYSTPYGKAIFKEGHDEGWRNYTVFFNERKTGIVIMTNSGNGEGIYKDLLESLLRDTFTPIEWEGFTPYDKLPPRPPLKEHKEVPVSARLLNSYAGRYGHLPDLILTIRREGDHLSIQENEEAKQELFPESESTFFSKVADDEFTFQVSADGHVSAMTLHAGGRDIDLKRISP